MNSTLISYSGLHDSSFRIKLAMELNSSNYVQIGDEKRRSNDAREHIENNSANARTTPSLSETRGEWRGFGSAEHLALPTVFEGKITKERKVSTQEKLSTIGKIFDWSLLAFSPKISASRTLSKQVWIIHVADTVKSSKFMETYSLRLSTLVTLNWIYSLIKYSFQLNFAGAICTI